MSGRYLGISVLLIFMLISGASMAEETADVAENSTQNLTGNETGALEPQTPVEVQPSDMPAGNESGVAENQTVNEVPDLQYIWILILNDQESITMVLNQTGESLVGAAKPASTDAEQWNADVIGKVTGNKVDLTMTALKGSQIVITQMSGAYQDPTIEGTFTQVSQGAQIASGTFKANWMDPNTAAYTPAVLTPVATQPETVQEPVQEQVNTTTESSAKKQRTFTDVTQFKEEVFSSPASIVPPGMGTVGGL